METGTFFSDETCNYRKPAEPDAGDRVHIRLRTGRYQAQKVFLCLSDSRIPMTWEEEKNDFDYYGADLTVPDRILPYWFRIEAEERTVLYDRYGASFEKKARRPFSIIPGFHIPDWAKGCLYYQIFPDRFCNSREDNDTRLPGYRYGGKPVISSRWGDPIQIATYRQFYGGDLDGIISKLPYLKSLGIEVIYLNPVFASPSSHKYDCCDYEHVDYGFGVPEDAEGSDHKLEELIESAHEQGIRIVLDGVFNHCSSYHRWFDRSGRFDGKAVDRGAYANPESRYHDRFTFLDKECLKYEAWWGVESLPKLNYEGDPSLAEEICGIAKKWISKPYQADGWRLDVAADLAHSGKENHRFWKKFRSAVREANPEALILAEHYEDPSPWLRGKEWDSVMNYNAFMEPVSWFFTGIDKHSDHFRPELYGNAEEFARSLREHSGRMPGNSLLAALNQLDNHDHSRFLTRTNHRTGRLEENGSQAASLGIDVSILRQAAAFLYFWPGSPGLYYGDEAGVCGFTDPDNRRCYPWNNPDTELIEYFGELGSLRKKCDFIREASCRILFAKDGVFAFARFTMEEAVVVVVSAATEAKNVRIPVWMAGYPGYEKERLLCGLMYSDPKGYTFQQRYYPSRYGIADLCIEPRSVTVFQ